MCLIVSNCVSLHPKHLLISEMKFYGNIEAKIDTKGRVFFPAQFRKLLQAVSEDQLVMRKHHLKDCIVFYRECDWDQTIDNISNQLDLWDEEQEDIFLQFMSDVETVNFEGTGRILIPKRYLKQCGFEQEVRFIGMNQTIQLWPEKKYLDACKSANEFGKTIAKLMKRRGENGDSEK